ncbi:MAG: translocation/assembly module TamB domain-containing protein, partial [Betaproteobacteria bacterium]
MLAAGALAALGWVLATQDGLRWAAAQAERAAQGRLRMEGVAGTLLRGVHIDRVRYSDDDSRIEAANVKGRASLRAALGGRLELSPLAIDRLVIELAAAAPPKARERLALPFGIRIAYATVESLEFVHGETHERLTEVRIAAAELGPRALSASASFSRPDERFPVTANLDVSGTFEKLAVDARARIAGIEVTGKANFALQADNKVESIDARAGPIDLARFLENVPPTALQAQLKASAAGRGFSGDLQVDNTLAGRLDEERIPVQSATLRFATQDLESAVLERMRIVLAGGGVLEGRGEADRDHFAATVNASRIDLQALRSTLRSTALQGPLEIDLRAARQTVRGSLGQAGMRLDAHAVRTGDTVEVLALRARAGGGEARGSGSVVLGEPLRFAAELDLRRFNPAAFGRYPEGDLNGRLQARGVAGRAPLADLNWSIAASRLAGRAFESRGRAEVSRQRVRGVEAQALFGEARLSARGNFGGAGDRLEWTASAARLEAFLDTVSGRGQASGTLSGTLQRPEVDATLRGEALELAKRVRLRTLDATVTGSTAKHELRAVARLADAEVQVHVRGSLERSRAWSGEIVSAASKGATPVRLVAPAPLRVSAERIELGRLEAALSEGRLLVREASWERGRLSSSGEFSGLPAQWLVVAAGAGERVQSSMLVDGNWTLAAAPRLDGALRLRRRSGDVVLLGAESSTPLGLSEAVIEGRFNAGRFVARMDASSRYGVIALEGSVAPDPDAAGALGFGAGSPLAFGARMQFVELPVLAQPLLLTARMDGRIAAELQGSGTLGKPLVKGTLRGDGLSFDMPPYGVYLRNGQLRATLEGERVVVQSFSIQGGAGLITAQGELPLRMAAGGAKLAWQAHNFSVMERPDMRLVATGEGEAGFDGKRVALSGIVRADRGHLAFERDRLPKLGADVVVLGRPRAKPAGRARLPLALDLQLDLGDALTVRAQGLDGRLTGKLQVVTTKDGELRGYGRVNMVHATYYAYGQSLAVDPGVLIFDGPLDNPSLQVTAWRRNLPVEAGVQVTGSARAPRLQLVSQPPVPEGERLSWLVLGRAPSDATKADLGLLQAAAGALLARGEAMPLDRRIARNFGLDELSFRGTGEVQDRVVAFGKRLSDRLYISYEQGLGQLATNLVKLDFSLGRRWSLRAETGTSSGAGL